MILPLCGERGEVFEHVASDPDDALSWARPRFAVVLVPAFSQPTVQVGNVGSARFVSPDPFGIPDGCGDQVIRMNAS